MRLPLHMRGDHLLVTLAVLLVGYWLWGRPEGGGEPGGLRRSPRAWSGALPDKNARVVRLEGDLKRPGVYVLKSGDSIDDVLRDAGAAGVISPARTAYVPSGTVLTLHSGHGEAQVVGMREMPPAEKLVLGQPLDINTLDAHALAHVPGLGPQRSERIVTERNRRGGFRSLTELESVPGIGPVIRKNVERYLKVGPVPSSDAPPR